MTQKNIRFNNRYIIQQGGNCPISLSTVRIEGFGYDPCEVTIEHNTDTSFRIAPAGKAAKPAAGAASDLSVLEVLDMNSNNEDGYKTFAYKVIKSQGEDIRRWSRQNDNPVLKKLAQEVLDAIKDENVSKEKKSKSTIIEKTEN